MELKWYNKQGKIYTDIQQNSMRYLFAEGITKLPVLYEKKSNAVVVQPVMQYVR